MIFFKKIAIVYFNHTYCQKKVYEIFIFAYWTLKVLLEFRLTWYSDFTADIFVDLNWPKYVCANGKGS